jgi:DNA primase
LRISSETLDQVRASISIEDVISRYIPSLQKRGQNYTGLCPFHKEKTPSFSVSPAKQIFYCFGCHTGGNVFTFISKIENIAFPDAVKLIAGLAGISIAHDRNERDDEKARLFLLNGRVMEEYVKTLSSDKGAAAMGYVKERGIEASSLTDFKIGYAPDSWDFISARVIKSKSDFEALARLGLLAGTEKNGQKRYYDKFRKRIMFPIFDQTGRVLAFGGRAIDDAQPKYLNSPESIIFQKRTVLYGFFHAQKHIKENNRAIVVEGYLDVIGCHQAGVVNVVAPMGTAITPEQLKSLSRICGEIIFLFDADSAGLKASLRALDIAENISSEIRVAVLPSDDPFDFIKKNGIRELMSVVDAALKPVDFKIKMLLSTHNESRSRQTLLGLFSIIKSISLETERNTYIKKVSSMFNLDENAFRKDFNSYINKRHVDVLDRSVNNKDESEYQIKIFRDLLVLLCNNPTLIHKAVIDYPDIIIPDPLFESVFKKLLSISKEEPNLSTDKIFDFFEDGPEIELLNQVINADQRIQNPETSYHELFVKMKVREIDDKINSYAQTIKNSKDNKFHEFIVEIEVLRRAKEKLMHSLSSL